MPIRINLLAEQQAADEARRRDPVKRALWVSAGLASLMVLWILLLQFRVSRAKAELVGFEAKLQAVEENSKEVRGNWATMGQLESRLANLQHYSTNRFFCATVLDSLQQLMVDDIRVVHLQSVHSYSTNAEASFKTNMVFPVSARHSWQFWKARVPQTNVALLVANQIAVLTGKVEMLKGAVTLITKTEVSTNGGMATANIDIIRPTVAVEQILLTIKARDYGNPPGRRVDDLAKAIASHPYFAQRLYQGEEGIRLRERAIQPEQDPSDPLARPLFRSSWSAGIAKLSGPMNKLSKEKRDKLLLIGLATGGVLLVLYFLVVIAQQDTLEDYAQKTDGAKDKLRKAEQWVRMAPGIQARLTTARQELEAKQEDMAPLDKFKWFYNTLEKFIAQHHVRLVDITREPEISEVGVLPKFPFQAATFGVKLNARFYDFGLFLSDFENQFPYMRVQNIELEPEGGTKVSSKEMAATENQAPATEALAITLRIVTLVKPSVPL